MRSYRAVLCCVLAVGLSSATMTATGWAQTASLPSAIRQSAAIGPQEQGQIEQFVTAQVANLSSGADAAAQSAARDALVAAAAGVPAFADAYAKAVNDAVTPLAKDEDWRVRLNAAIVAAKVADKTNSPRLRGAALAFLGDKEDSVALWGVKTARAVVPATFAAQGAAASPDVIRAVTETALKRKSGPITAEAYQTLAPKIATDTKNVEPLVKAAVPELLRLMAARNQMYMTGTPDEPTAENTALLFLSYEPVWNAMPDQQKQAAKQAAMQRVSDLVGLAGQRAATASRTEMERLVPLLQQAGKALQVIAARQGDAGKALEIAAANLAKVNLSTPGAQAASAAAAVYPAVKALPQFADLTPPPTVSPVAPAPETAGPATTKSVQ